MNTPADINDSSILLASLPVDGAPIGNQALREKLRWGAERYTTARQPLIETGLVLTGRGRGGSVRRAAAGGEPSYPGGRVPSPAATATSYPTAAKNRAADKRASISPELPLDELVTKPPAPKAGLKKAERAAKSAAPVKTLEVQLWDAANKMRGAVPPTDYMHVCLGLVFLRYLSAAFERKETELKETPFAVMDDPEEYQADNVFWVPREARWSTLQGFARSADVGKRLDDAMRAIERENEELKGVLPKIFGKADFSAQMLGGLIDHFTNLNLAGMADDFDFLGRVYEFFLGEFSAMQGKAGGEQFTPRSMVTLMVEMIEPYRGRIYDCCHGTGGFYVQSNRFVLAHAGRLDDIAVFGQERNPETYRLARMNLAIRGITGDLRWNNEGTLLKDAFPDMRFDFILANPPFNIKEWGGEFLRDDARWKFGAPPLGNANYAWLQHIYHHLAPTGYGAVILANGSMSSNSGGEGEIRKAMVEGDAVDCMVALPNQLFFGTQIPVCVWIMAKDKSGGKHGTRKLRDRRGEVLFIDARKLGYMVNRTNKNLSEADIAKLTDTYHAWREGSPIQNSKSKIQNYQDVSGFCKSASIEEIRAHGHVLTPGRYVGAEDVEEDDEAFEKKMPRLAAALRERFAKRALLEKQVNRNLEGMGYGH